MSSSQLLPLAARIPQLSELLEAVESRLADLVGEYDSQLADLAAQGIAAGGKRLRPALVFLSAGDLSSESFEQLERAAAAVELIHSATLIHDDVLDQAQLRRGVPTVVAQAGRSAATGVGDLLFARAFACLAENDSEEQLRVLTAASLSLARGELLQRADAWNVEVSTERYLCRCKLKTAALFEAACKLGALCGEAPVDVLAEFGQQIGLAFQLVDDVLDITGKLNQTGKQRGTDLLDGTVTLPLILARKRDRQLEQLDLRSVRDSDGADEICTRIISSGAVREAREQAFELVENAKITLQVLPSEQRAQLEEVAEGVVSRFA